MEHRDAGLEQGRPQVGEEVRQLGADEESLVDHGPARERTDKELQTGPRRLALDEAARQVQAPLPGLRIEGPCGRSDEQLSDRRLAGGSERAEHAAVHRDDAPSQHRHSEAHQDALDQIGGVIERGSGRQEEHPQRDTLGGPDAEQAMGDLRQDTGAVAGFIVGRRAPVREARDGGERHGQDVGGADAVRARDEADAAGVALAPGIEQTKSPLR